MLRVSAVRRSSRRVAGGALAGLLALTLLPAAAGAGISSATTIDGPSPAIIDVGGVAMSGDGTGGLVYRKRVDGRAHIFASRFVGGAWQPPQQVDVGQRFDSSWPVIGAGDDGRLVVAWVQEFGVGTDRMFFSVVGPGATTFQRPQVLDPNVGEATATYPSIAVNPGGQGLLTYRVILNDQPGPTLPAGYVDADIRLARFDGSYWSVSGTPVERNPDQPERTPSAANSPKVAIGVDGGGLVAWQEPDDSFYDRIYARRVFGAGVGFVITASPTRIGSRDLHAGVDSFALTEVGFGTGGVVMRQLPPPDGGFTRPRVYVNQIPTSFDVHAGAFEGARVVDGAGADGPAGGVGGVGLGLDTLGAFDAVFSSGAQTLEVRGDESRVNSPRRLDDGSSTVAGDPLVTLADSGALAAAWKVLVRNAGAVSVLSRAADGTPERRLAYSARGGTVRDLRLAGSGLGDAAIGWRQGDESNTTIQGASVDAPPDSFGVATPPTWVRGRSVRLDWDHAPHAIGDVSYSVLVDDQIVAAHLTATSYRVRSAAAGDGAHVVRIVATDTAGQEGDSNPADLLLDRSAPRVRIRVGRSRRTAVLRVSDGQRGESSGVGAVRVSWGDGSRNGGRAHQYPRHGTYRVRIVVADKAGNRGVVRRRVRV